MQLGRGANGWFFTAAVVVGPAAWLFHSAFLERIIVPFVRALGGIT
jgi:hypothetical protein